MSEVINFRTEKKTKAAAQAIAKKMGLNLSDVLNVFLHTFIRTRKLNVNLEEPSDWLLSELAEADADIKAGRVSPMFDNAEDAIKWLDKKDRKYANRI